MEKEKRDQLEKDVADALSTLARYLPRELTGRTSGRQTRSDALRYLIRSNPEAERIVGHLMGGDHAAQ